MFSFGTNFQTKKTVTLKWNGNSKQGCIHWQNVGNPKKIAKSIRKEEKVNQLWKKIDSNKYTMDYIVYTTQ